VPSGCDGRQGHGAPLDSPPQLVNAQTESAGRGPTPHHLLGKRRELPDPILGEPVVATRSHLIGLEVAFPASPDHRVLADAQQACSVTAPDQLRAADQIGRRCRRVRFDVL